MSGFTGKKTSGAPDKPERRDVVLSLTTARGMLPLVRRIVADLLQYEGRLAELLPEQEELDRQRRTLDWPHRQRRYQIREDVAAVERCLHETLAELEGLGLVLEGADGGQVGFPTVINGRRALFSWQSGEEGLGYWHFLGEAVRRPIPPAWTETGYPVGQG
jgi:hypothetical protein